MISSNDHASSPEISKTTSENVILVFGATGQQGGAVASALLADGWSVRALVRDLKAPKARDTASLNIEVVQGDFNDEASIRSAMTGVYGVFSVQPSSGQGAAYGVSDQDEIRYGTMIADIAAQVGVSHLVYTSVNAAGPEKTGMGHFDSKSQIEAHIRSLDISSTIIRPAGFMELLMLPGLGLDQDAYVSFLRPTQIGQVIAVRDIGKIVAGIFSNPGRFAGRTIEIAGDELTGESLQRSLSRAAGRPIGYSRFPDAVLKENEFLRRLTALFDDGRLAGHADIGELRREFGHLLSFDEWLDGPGRPLFEAAQNASSSAIALR